MQSRVHVSLEVARLSESIAFYSRLFRTEPTKVRPDYANFRLDEPGIHLALVETPHRVPEPETGPGSNRHFGIELFAAERLQEWLKASQAAGLSLRVEDDITCCYARANKFWARDPDGHNWEFWVRTAEADAMYDENRVSPTSEAESACCAPSAPANNDSASCCAPSTGCCP